MDYKDAPANGKARGSGNGGDCSKGVARGGGWLSAPKKVRTANRIKVHTNEANYFTGLRVARDL